MAGQRPVMQKPIRLRDQPSGGGMRDERERPGDPDKSQEGAEAKSAEEAHFRIDDVLRRLEAVTAALPSADVIAGIAHGAVAAFGEELKRELARVSGMRDDDSQADRELAGLIRELIEKLSKPTERTGTIMLPSGPVTMTITEKR